MIAVQLPANAVPGGQMQVTDPNTNQPFIITLAADATPGQIIHVPKPPPVAVVVPQGDNGQQFYPSFDYSRIAPQPGSRPQGEPIAVAQAQTSTIVQPVRPTFYNSAVQMQCPGCNRDILSQTEKIPGLVTYLTCFGCFLVGCWFGPCLLPFCCNDLKNTRHKCPECAMVLGEYRPI